MKYLLLLTGLFLFSFTVQAQQKISIKGKVISTDGNPLPEATVVLLNKNGKDSLKTVSTDKGLFAFNEIQQGVYQLRISFVGYTAVTNEYDCTNTEKELVTGDIVLNPSNQTLQNLTLESQKVQIKEDTVSYKIDSTMYRKNDNVETLLKQLPGVQVDKDGTVTAQGKQVTKVKVNGKEFFGGDVTTATRELNADMVDRVQIIDDYGDQAAFTGVKDGDPSKTLNIQLKKDRNKGYFGTVTAGAGTEDRYLGSLSVNKFNNDQQISLLANINNTNASLFNFGSGGGAMGNMMAGMARSMGIGRGGGGIGSALGNFGNSDGINTNKSIGLNYRDQWGPKLSVYGSYSFSKKYSDVNRDITQQNIFEGKTNTNVQQTNNYSITDNHRFSYNIEYKIDSMNYIKFTPSVSYTKTNNDYLSDFYYLDSSNIKSNNGLTSDNTVSTSPNLNGNLLFNHRFKKRGRTLSLNLSGAKSGTEADDDYSNVFSINVPGGGTANRSIEQDILQDNKNHSYGIRGSYTEPLSKKRSLEFNYAYNRQFTGNDRKTYVTNPVTGTSNYIDSLSSIYDNVYETNRFGANFRTNEKKYNYTIGLAVQPATIRSNTLTGAKNRYVQHIVNYYPVIRFAYNFSRSRSFNVNYNGSTSQPSFSQLQPVYDYSNPQYITIGNPSLRPEFTNTLSMRYNNFDFISGDVFFGNISFSFTRDKIVNNVKQVRFNVQETRYLNSDGFFTVFGFYNISKPIKSRKYVFNFGGNITYNNNVSFVTDSADVTSKNKGRNWVFGQRVSTDIKIKKWLETNVSLNYSLNSSRYSILTNQNANTGAWTISHNSRIFLPHSFIISYDIDKTINNGYADNVTVDPLIINGTIEKQMFKKKNGSLKMQAFDLLNENTSISRTVTGSAITDSRTNRLGRYFLLSFVLRLNKFSGQQPAPTMMRMGGPEGGGMQMMRPGF